MQPGKVYFLLVAVGTTLIAFATGPFTIVRVQFVMQAIFFFWLFMSFRVPGTYTLTSKFYLFIFAQGFLIGVSNVFLGDNELLVFLQYTLIYAVGYIALQCGLYLRRVLDQKEIGRLLSWICIADLTLFLPRLLVVGLYIRSALGTTYLLPMLALANPFKSFKTLGVSVCLFVAFLLCVLSGLRSTLFAMMALIGVTIFLLPARRNVVLLALGLLTITVVLAFSDQFRGVIEMAERSLKIVEIRMRQTLLNEDGFRLDPGVGRKEEATIAIEAFRERSGAVAQVFGQGFGFVYEQWATSWTGSSAHVHITPVAYYIRNGVFGVLFFFWVLAVCIRSTWYSFRHYASNRFPFVLGLIASSYLLMGFVFGTLVNPVVWLVVGVLPTYDTTGRSRVTKTELSQET